MEINVNIYAHAVLFYSYRCTTRGSCVRMTM